MISYLILFCFAISVTSASPKATATKQILDIVRDPKRYDKEIFPKESGAINVDINMLLRRFDVDDLNMRAFVDLTFRMMWRDHRVSFDVAGVNEVRFHDYTHFWTPDPFFKGSIETKQMRTVHPEAYISFNKRGNATFSTRFHLTLKCDMDLSRFPHDTQICPITVASYGFAKVDVIFKFAENVQVKIIDKRSASDRFLLKDIKTETCHSKTSTGEYSCLVAFLTLKRNFSSYLFEWYLPCISLVIVAFFSELIAVDALLPRLLLTVAPLLTLTACSISYSSKTASVPYATALDLFTGISLLTVFVTLLHVIIGYYYSIVRVNGEKKDKETKPDEEAVVSTTRTQKLRNKLREKGDYYVRICIIGFYLIFLFLYFLAYSTQ